MECNPLQRSDHLLQPLINEAFVETAYVMDDDHTLGFQALALNPKLNT